MKVSDIFDIQEEIDRYFQEKATIDFNVHRDLFSQRCAAMIWESFCFHYDCYPLHKRGIKHAEDFIETLKVVSGSEVLPIATISTNLHIFKLRLADSTWYLHEGPGDYSIVPRQVNHMDGHVTWRIKGFAYKTIRH